MIKLDTYCLEKLDIYGRHYSLLQGMSMDKKIQLYIARDFLKYLSEYQAVSDDKIEVGKMYAFIKGDREIGIVGSTKMDSEGILDVIYAIKKSERGKGHGANILNEITNYYLNNINGIKGIKLVIDEVNKESIGTAKLNGYEKVGINLEGNVGEWYYSKDVESRLRK